VTATRKDLAIPNGWKVTHHAHVQVLDHAKLTPADLPVRGVWRAISQGPDSGWWLQPSDQTAQRWLAAHGTAAGAQSGMVLVHRLRCVPAFLQLTVPGVR
jgi:hypothetical protein